MGKSTEKLVGKKIAVIGGTSGYVPNSCYARTKILVAHQSQHNPLTPRSIGFGAAQILLDAGAIVTVISSDKSRVDDAVERLASPNVSGRAGDVRDEESFAKLLRSLAPLDHVIFSGVDKIIRGSLADADLDDAKHLFGVKFWGSVVIGKGM